MYPLSVIKTMNFTVRLIVMFLHAAVDFVGKADVLTDADLEKEVCVVIYTYLFA